MKDYEFYNIINLVNVGGGWVPANENAQELLDASGKGEIISVLEVTSRDLSFHKAYFALLKFIWGYMSSSFQKAVPEDKFYLWLKHLKGQYKVLFEFKDGTKLVEYESIAFGRMSQKTFENYVRDQLPWIYENVIGAYFEGDIYNGIIDTIEEEFKKFLSKL